LAEIRRGYLWNGRVFRFAQVQVSQDSKLEEPHGTDFGD
jgi:hypothetical protein